jgi:hypothetical protein
MLCTHPCHAWCHCTHCLMLYVCLCGWCAISSPSVISARGVDYLFWLFGLSSVIRIRPRCTACIVHRPCTCLLSHAPILMDYGCGTDRSPCYRRQCRGGDGGHREHGARDVADAGQAGCRPFRDSIVSASGGSACACCAGVVGTASCVLDA